MLDVEDHSSLNTYLHASGKLPHGQTLKHQVLAGGVSNKTVLVTFEDGRVWVIKQALAKLRVKVDWMSDPARIHREAAGMRALLTLAPLGAITGFVFEDFENHVMAMEAVPQPHENLKTLLMAGTIHADWIRQLAALLASIHRKSTARRDELMPAFVDRTYFESLRLEPYYTYSATVDPGMMPFLHKLTDDTRRQQLSLVHGDFSPKNVLVFRGQLILLDHEVIHWGDPAFDIGFCMAHFLSKANHLRASRAQFLSTARSFWDQYLQNLGSIEWKAELGERAGRHTLACLLARVVGRSPLEYLTERERETQKQAVHKLSASGGDDVALVIQRFGEFLEESEQSCRE